MESSVLYVLLSRKMTMFLELFTPTLFLNCYTTFMLSLSTLSSSLFLLNIGSSWYIDFSPTFFSGLVVWCALLLIFESSINCKGCSTLYLLHFLVLYTRVSFIISGCRLCWGTFFHRIHVNALLYIVFKVSLGTCSTTSFAVSRHCLWCYFPNIP